MMNEQCWVLLGGIKDNLWWGKMLRPTSGCPVSVAFDASWVIEQEEKGRNVVGFYHTHPNMSNHYSSRDDRTMKAWYNCLGKPLACCIQGANGLAAWWYLNDEDAPRNYEVKKVKKLVFGLTPEVSYEELRDTE